MKTKAALAKEAWRCKGNNRQHERDLAHQWRKKNPMRIKSYKRKEYIKHRDKYLKFAERRAKSHPILMKRYQKEYLAKRHRTFRIAALMHYSVGKMRCKCCGEKMLDFLTLDHVFENGSAHRKLIGSAQIFKYLKDKGYPSGFQVLCMNCNFGRSLKYNHGICPHKQVSK